MEKLFSCGNEMANFVAVWVNAEGFVPLFALRLTCTSKCDYKFMTIFQTYWKDNYRRLGKSRKKGRFKCPINFH
jgi:hypothetical protein